MKTKINCVSGWVLCVALVISNLSGCSSIQNNPMYNEWQARAYTAYGMEIPSQPSDPYMTPELRTEPMTQPSTAELMYIAEHYGLQ